MSYTRRTPVQHYVEVMSRTNTADLLKSPAKVARFFALCGYGEHDIISYLVERLNVTEPRAAIIATTALAEAEKADEEIDYDIRSYRAAVRAEWALNKEDDHGESHIDG